jgi:hypothetical protein
MFIMDVPYVPVQTAPLVLAQAAAGSNTPPADFILNACQETDDTTPSWSAMRVVDPSFMLKNYIEGRDVPAPVNLADIKTTLLQGTRHGKIATEVDNTGLSSYRYDPDSGYLGRDKAVFLAEYAGKRYKINIEIKVLVVVDERQPVCDDPVMIKAPKPAKRILSYNMNLISLSYKPNPAFKRDALKRAP